MIGDGFAAVLAAAQAGDEASFAALWRDGNPALLRYLRVLAPDAADDVAAETWMQVTRGLGEFTGDESAWRGWLFTVARRRAIDDGRRRSRRPRVSIDEMSEADWPRAPDAADAAMENVSTAAAIALISALPRLQAEVILLRVVAGLDNERVADVLGRSPGAVRVAAHRGLRRLAELVTQAAVTP